MLIPPVTARPWDVALWNNLWQIFIPRGHVSRKNANVRTLSGQEEIICSLFFNATISVDRERGAKGNNSEQTGGEHVLRHETQDPPCFAGTICYCPCLVSCRDLHGGRFVFFLSISLIPHKSIIECFSPRSWETDKRLTVVPQTKQSFFPSFFWPLSGKLQTNIYILASEWTCPQKSFFHSVFQKAFAGKTQMWP